MTFPSSGTQNSVTAALNGVTAAQVATALLPGGAIPAGMKPGGRTSNWVDPGMVNNYNVIETQAALVYRM